MDMDHLIGQRFSLISKSEIRYVGTLHEINPEQSTIALEDVFSYGTEDRKPDNFIPASNQQFQYIVFRGSDVKDIKIVEAEQESKQASPPSIPNDPAILNSSRPGPPQGAPQGPPQNRGESPFPPPGHPQHQQFQGYYPPPQYGRGFPPPPPGGFGPGPGFNYPPPPPGYFGPPGQGFPPGPNQFQQPPPPMGGPPQRNHLNQQGQQDQPQRRGPPPSQPTSELPVDNKSGSKQASASTTPAPQTLASDAKPIVPPTGPSAFPVPPKTAPTQPKGNRVTMPAMPFTVNQKSFTPPVATAAEPVANGASKSAAQPSAAAPTLDEARNAVAAALAKLPQTGAQPKPMPSAASINVLSKKVSEMGPSSNGTQRGRGNYRGRAAYPRSGSGGHQTKKIEIPKSDYDFESANAKFNKEDLVKEAIASGSPAAEAEDEMTGPTPDDEIEGLQRKDSIPAVTGKASYNKTSSFFDNISSEARDREEHKEMRQNARQLRGDEFNRNVETFGQGNVDGGFRGRGRGRGRSYGGTYRGGYRGYSGGYRGRGRGGGQGPDPNVAQS